MKLFPFVLILICICSCQRETDVEEHNVDIVDNQQQNDDTSLKIDTANHEMDTSKRIELTCNWMLLDGWFPDQDLSFHRIDQTNQNFRFNEDGTIDYLMPNGFGDCPVGVFTLREGKWLLSEQYLTIELKGLKVSDYWYWWKVRYKIIELTANKLKLQVIKVLKNKEISPTMTWEDLIN
jgi:hypothetical protein